MATGLELTPPPSCSLSLIRDHYGDCDGDADGGVDFDSYLVERKRRCMIPRPATTTTTTTIDHLCDALLIDIFLRLPFQFAKRCSAVCKRWYALLSEPHFIRRFEQGLQNNNKNFAFVFHYHKLMAVGSNEPAFKSRGFSLTYLPCYRRQPDLVELPSVVASCNDLLLLCDDEVWSREIYYLCNPFTLDWVQLPPAPFPRYPQVVGFICDNSTAAASFTVLRVARLPSSCNLKVDIFSSDTEEWRFNVVSTAPRTIDPYPIRQNGIPFNGLLFWLLPGQGLLGLDPHDGGQFRHFIDVPEKFHDTVNGGFGVCLGRLRLFQVAKDPLLNIPFICIWDLKDLEQSEWVLEKQVYFRDMVGVPKNSNFAWLTKGTTDALPQVLGCVPDDGDVVHIVALNTHENVCKVVSCNLRMGTLEAVCDVLSNHENALSLVNTCRLSWWPTPIPAIPSPTDFFNCPLIEKEEEQACA